MWQETVMRLNMINKYIAILQKYQDINKLLPKDVNYKILYWNHIFHLSYDASSSNILK